MAFKLLPISDDYLPMVKEISSLHISSYRQTWAIDPESSDCLIFIGRDYLDPSVPSYFALLTRNQKEHWSFEMLSIRYCGQRHIEDFLLQDEPKPDYVVVLKPNESYQSNPDIIKTKIRDAVRALEKRPGLEFLFIPRWNGFR
ncbi:hypothetical protein [Deefgea rivuli]|uniref:hypothetical protein n=1 Tax=Deefgea rivuli TaxID=400948 RepID=UPI0012EBFF41|nr:hypothetical protein [Deefgea rivuli]